MKSSAKQEKRRKQKPTRSKPIIYVNQRAERSAMACGGAKLFLPSFFPNLDVAHVQVWSGPAQIFAIRRLAAALAIWNHSLAGPFKVVLADRSRLLRAFFVGMGPGQLGETFKPHTCFGHSQVLDFSFALS